MWNWTLGQMPRAARPRYTRIAADISRTVTGYMFGNLLTSLIAGIVVFVTLLIVGVPFPLLWGLWVALVDFLPMIGGALAGIPTVLFAFIHSFTAGIVTAIVFLVYTQIENHVLNPVVMSKTVQINPLLVFISILVGASLGSLSRRHIRRFRRRAAGHPDGRRAAGAGQGDLAGHRAVPVRTVRSGSSGDLPRRARPCSARSARAWQ